MLSSAGIGSGLDIQALVTDLVSAQAAPKIALFDKQEASLTAQISAYGLFKSALSELHSTLAALAENNTYNTRTATSSDSTKFSASADATAAFGNYGIEVERLASSHKLTSSGFTDTATVVGTGSLTLSVGDDAFTLTIDDDNKSLGGIRDAINNATDNTGVTATIINVDDGLGGIESQLVLTSNDTGSENAITVTAVNGGEGDLQQLVYDPLPGSGVENMTEVNLSTELDSIVYIDGQQLTSSSNSLSNPIEGVSISLLDAEPGTTFTLSVNLNTSSIKTAITSMVEKYNDYVETLTGVTSYAETGSGALIGDALTRSASNQVRTQLTGTVDSVTSEYSSLAAIGIVSDRDGFLIIESDKLDAALADDITAIENLFTAPDGIATKLDNTLNEYVKSSGILDSKTTSLSESIDDITDQRERLALQLEALEAQLLSQFIYMDTVVAQLKATGDSLTQALANLPKPNSVGNS